MEALFLCPWERKGKELMDPDLEQVKETGSEQCTSSHEESNDEKHADKYEIDWKAEAQKWEAQAKANKDAIGKLEEAAKTDERKRQEKIARLEKEVASYKQQAQIAEWSRDIVKGSNIPASVLRGDTREELEKHFSQLQQLLPYQAQASTAFKGFEKEPKQTISSSSSWLKRLFGEQ